MMCCRSILWQEVGLVHTSHPPKCTRLGQQFGRRPYHCHHSGSTREVSPSLTNFILLVSWVIALLNEVTNHFSFIFRWTQLWRQQLELFLRCAPVRCGRTSVDKDRGHAVSEVSPRCLHCNMGCGGTFLHPLCASTSMCPNCFQLWHWKLHNISCRLPLQ